MRRELRIGSRVRITKRVRAIHKTWEVGTILYVVGKILPRGGCSYYLSELPTMKFLCSYGPYDTSYEPISDKIVGGEFI